ncbi:MAG: hypothetical protein ACE5KX_06720 [Acidimicrobiia bacterium]
MNDPYIRRFWTAVIGPGAVADLLRLVTAAKKRIQIRRPLYLGVLAREGLVRAENGRLWIRPTIPPLSVTHARRLPPLLRQEHRELRWQRREERSLPG